MIEVLMLSAGNRSAFAESVSSFKKNLRSTSSLHWVVYGSDLDATFREWTMKNFPWVSEVKRSRHQLREAWRSMNAAADYVFQFSDDFELDYEFDLDATVSLIDDRPYLAQLSLVQVDHGEVFVDSLDREWTQHDVGWSSDPSLYRTVITEMGWPVGQSPEDRLTAKLRRNSSAWRFAALRSDPPIC